MPRFVDGEWRTDAELSRDEDGAYERQESRFRDWIESDGPHPPEADRYHLYVSYACPWAHRTLITRALLGLEDAVSVSVVDPYRDENGWQFTPDRDGCTVDHVHGADYLRELYRRADPDVTGRVTVPVLWDREADTIVNNESREIMRMFADDLASFGAHDVELSPVAHRDRIDAVLDAIYEPINNGVYRTGFATSQSAYDAAVTELFAALDRWDAHLADRRYLVGDGLTEADVAMFTTLVRFDAVYHTHFKCNVRLIQQYDHLWPYLRDLYHTPGFGETVRMDHIVEHYYTTHRSINPHGIVPRGPELDFAAPHDRDSLPGEPPAIA